MILIFFYFLIYIIIGTDTLDESFCIVKYHECISLYYFGNIHI